MKKKLPYSSIFSSLVVKPIVSEDKDKYLSKASLKKLQKFLPNIDAETNYDLLPISFSACVVNRVNLNRDGITTATALQIYKTFINKSINIEHNRKKVIGVILNAGFSEFGTENPLTEEEIKDYKEPFNITLGGVIWRTVDDDLADLVEDCADPSSENYLKISASWELGFLDFSVAKIKGDSKNLEDAEIIGSKDEIENVKKYLTCFGGSGKQDEYNYYRIPSEGVLAVGIGLTETPAAEVKGVAVASKEEVSAVLADNSYVVTPEKDKELTANFENNEIKISQAENKDVNSNRIDMKITSVKDITDENLKTIAASSVTEFIAQEIQKADQKYIAEKQEKENAEKLFKDSLAKSEQDLNSAKAELNTLKEELSKLKDVISLRQKEESFSARMSELDEQYNLDDEDRQVLASDIKDLDDAGYDSYKKNLKVFFKNRKKEDKPVEAVASVPKEDKVEQNVVAEVVSNAAPETAKVTTSTMQEVSLKDKYAKAFALENILIKK